MRNCRIQDQVKSISLFAFDLNFMSGVVWYLLNLMNE